MEKKEEEEGILGVVIEKVEDGRKQEEARGEDMRCRQGDLREEWQ